MPPLLLAPADGATVLAGRPIVLQGQGYYLEERQTERDRLTWTSSLDGERRGEARLTLTVEAERHDSLAAFSG